MPVLIDFGVVKELATKVQSSHLAAPLTNVGKFGYAPWEQIQLGRATANSDLYALAVTVVVLLTGKEPQQLIDQTTLTWNWQRWVAVSLGLAEVINRMLSHQPGDRYQSVTEVDQALERLPHIKSQQLPTINQEQNNPSSSQQPTIGATPNQNLNPNSNHSFFDNHQWVATALVAVLVVLSGVVSWSAVNFFLKRRQQEAQLQQPTKMNPIPVPTLAPPPSSPIPTSSPSPTTTSTLSPTLPSPLPVVPVPSGTPEIPITILPNATPIPETPAPVIIPSPSITSEERLNISPGEPISIEGRLRGNESIDYIISGSLGQNLNLLVTGEGVLMSLVAIDGEPVDGISEKVSIWKGTLPNDGDYKITLAPLPGLPGTDYKLDINLVNPIPKVIPSSEPEATELPAPIQEPEATESPSGLQLNKPSKKESKKSFPISTPLEELDKPSKKPKKQIVIPETEATASPTPAEETSSDAQILVE
ncbi:MAG: hypothetical protein F6K13_23455 [Okeania sp. SIO2B9]|nr:hypothetical protein [Okeania sp. SIO2B9]